MDKIYITRAKLEEIINNHIDVSQEYPKPILFLLSVLIFSILVLLAVIVAILVILLVTLLIIIYGLLWWIDLILGKYILKRIFK
jgi:hypothetical protein